MSGGGSVGEDPNTGTDDDLSRTSSAGEDPNTGTGGGITVNEAAGPGARTGASEARDVPAARRASGAERADEVRGAGKARPARVIPYDRLKRAIDVVLVLVGMVLLAPLFAVLAWRVQRELGSPVLFRQVRPGQHGELFELRKFRTMTDERGPDGQLLPDEERLTGFGRWLRSTSLDEIPEMVNVLNGEMSLVGPRPLLVAYLERYSPTQARRHEVRPGITGWSQINGRNNMSWDDKLALDVWYVDHRSFVLDVRILLTTLWVMVTRRGVSLDGHATTVPFHGPAAPDERPGAAGTEAGGAEGDRQRRPDEPGSG